MRRLTLLFLVLFLFSSLTVSVGAEPHYAKWGTLAVAETQKKYHANIIDYKYMGRTEIMAKKSEEKFKLWLKSKDGREFGVFVTVQYDPSTDAIQTIQFKESDQS
jgi:hypothetical protein